MKLLYSCHINRVGLDSLGWSLTCSKKYEVKSFYKALLQPDHLSFPWRSVWKVKVPTRVALFTWEKERWLFWIGVAYVKVMMSLLITCLCIVLLPRSFEIWCLLYSGLFGLCLRVWRSYLHAGLEDLGSVKQVLFGRLFPIASCGVFGVSAMLAHFLGRKHLCQLWSSQSYNLYLSSRQPPI